MIDVVKSKEFAISSGIILLFVVAVSTYAIINFPEDTTTNGPVQRWEVQPGDLDNIVGPPSSWSTTYPNYMIIISSSGSDDLSAWRQTFSFNRRTNEYTLFSGDGNYVGHFSESNEDVRTWFVWPINDSRLFNSARDWLVDAKVIINGEVFPDSWGGNGRFIWPLHANFPPFPTISANQDVLKAWYQADLAQMGVTGNNWREAYYGHDTPIYSNYAPKNFDPLIYGDSSYYWERWYTWGYEQAEYGGSTHSLPIWASFGSSEAFDDTWYWNVSQNHAQTIYFEMRKKWGNQTIFEDDLALYADFYDDGEINTTDEISATTGALTEPIFIRFWHFNPSMSGVILHGDANSPRRPIRFSYKGPTDSDWSPITDIRFLDVEITDHNAGGSAGHYNLIAISDLKPAEGWTPGSWVFKFYASVGASGYYPFYPYGDEWAISEEYELIVA